MLTSTTSNSEALIEKTQAASQQWQECFNRGDASGCAALYESNAEMLAKPFGLYIGRNDIKNFWQALIEQGYNQISYREPHIQTLDDRSTLLTSGWTMNKARGVITRELWVLQDDGTMRLREDHFEAQGEA